MTLKDKLIKEGKYDQVMKIVEDIKEKMSRDERYCIGYQCDDYGNIIQYVNKMNIAYGADLWEKVISAEGSHRDVFNAMNPFYWYVERELDMKLHNYANSLVRGSTPVETIEDIRPWSDLWDTLTEIMFY